MKYLLIGPSVPVLLTHTAVIADQRPSRSGAIFNGDYHYYQTVDRFNNVSRITIDAFGQAFGT
jgi:hypothetical protein